LGNQDTSGTAGNNEDPSATKHKDRNYKTRTPGDQAEAVKKIEKHVYVLKLPNGKVLEQDEPFDIEVIRKMKLVSPFGSPVKILELEESHHEIHHIEYFECRHYMRLDYSQKEPPTMPSEATPDAASGAVEGTTMPSEATPDAASGAVEGTTMPSETTPDGASGAVEGTTMPSETTPDASSGAVEGTTMPSEVTPDGASGAVEGTTMPSETVSDASSGAVEGTTMPSEATPAGASGAVEGTTMPSETVSDAASVADEETTAHTETAPNSSATHTVRHSIFAKLPFIKNSPLSSSLLAWIISLRFCLCASGYKILDAIHRKGYDCSDGTPYNWFHLGARMLRPLKDRLCYLIKQEKRLHCDESPGDVHGEEGRANSTKSYFWFLTTIEEAAHKICVVFYCPGRGGVFPADFLRGFIGKLITDAYQAYNYVPYCIRCLCNSHSRRNFFTAAICGITHLRRSKAKDIVALFDKIFEYERSFKGKTPAEKEILRQELVKPLMDEIGRLCREIQSDPRLYAGKLKKAVFYFLHNEQGLRRFLDDGLIPASNNLAERMVKPFALLRSVSLFWASPTGADDCSVLMTVVRTAELNGLDVEPYLEYVFTRISETPENMRDDVFYDSLLPFSADMQQRFRLSERKERT